MDGRAHCVPFFRSVGEFGVSSFAFANPEDASAPMFYSSGADLWQLDSARRATLLCDVRELVDVHEIGYERDRILIANTRRDEIASFQPRGGAVDRLSLESFRGRAGGLADPRESALDRFHVNQAFRGIDGHLWALVHHFEGWQLLRRVIGGVIKSHGDGGVLNLDTRSAINLRLAAPHSVRIVGGEYWLLNSGCNEIAVYSPTWEKRRTMPSAGWGRGLAVSGEIAYVGISPLRRRYRPLADRSDQEPMIQAVHVSSGKSLTCALLRNLEQVNNVYRVARALAESLVSL